MYSPRWRLLNVVSSAFACCTETHMEYSPMMAGPGSIATFHQSERHYVYQIISDPCRKLRLWSEVKFPTTSLHPLDGWVRPSRLTVVQMSDRCARRFSDLIFNEKCTVFRSVLIQDWIVLSQARRYLALTAEFNASYCLIRNRGREERKPPACLPASQPPVLPCQRRTSLPKCITVFLLPWLFFSFMNRTVITNSPHMTAARGPQEECGMWESFTFVIRLRFLSSMCHPSLSDSTLCKCSVYMWQYKDREESRG